MSRSAKPYEPVPGTIPHQVIKHLESMPPGTKLTSAELIESMGQTQTQLVNLGSLMVTAVREGWVKKQPKPMSRLVLWSLGDRKPLQQADATSVEDDDDDTRDLAGPTPTPNLAVASVFAMARSTEVEAKPADTAAPQASRFRCALFNDGTLYIHSNGVEHTLPTEHTRQLLRYLDALGSEEIGA